MARYDEEFAVVIEGLDGIALSLGRNLLDAAGSRAWRTGRISTWPSWVARRTTRSGAASSSFRAPSWSVRARCSGLRGGTSSSRLRTLRSEECASHTSCHVPGPTPDGVPCLWPNG